MINDFFSLFFPNYCFGCKGGLVKGEEILCTLCLAELPLVDYYNSNDNPIVNKFVGRIPVKYGWALFKFKKSGVVQQLLHQLKYNNRPEIGERLGKMFAHKLLENGHGKAFDMIIPIPLHKSKKRSRGYNQSSMIARGMSDVLQTRHTDSLIERVSATSTQTKKTKMERWDNVNYAFRVTDPSLISGKRILVIDDVITTGSTFEACIKTLLEAGAAEISIGCLAEA